MGLKVKWSGAATDQLDEALAYIALDNRAAAQKLSAQIRAATGKLGLYPMKGRMVPERQDPSFREVIVGPFRIIYSTKEPALVRILTVIRGERMLPKELA